MDANTLDLDHFYDTTIFFKKKTSKQTKTDTVKASAKQEQQVQEPNSYIKTVKNYLVHFGFSNMCTLCGLTCIGAGRWGILVNSEIKNSFPPLDNFNNKKTKNPKKKKNLFYKPFLNTKIFLYKSRCTVLHSHGAFVVKNVDTLTSRKYAYLLDFPVNSSICHLSHKV